MNKWQLNVGTVAIQYHSYIKPLFCKAISWQRPTTNIKYDVVVVDMVCVKLMEITEWMLIKFWYIDNFVMFTFIPWILLVLQKIESSDLDGGGTLPGLCRFVNYVQNINYVSTNKCCYSE